MTVNQLRQVLRVYTSQWVLWALAILFLLFSLWRFSVSFANWRSAELDWSTLLFPDLLSSFFLGIALGGILGIQFANARARLLPGFAAAHLAVAGGIIATVVATQAVLAPVWMGFDGRLAAIGLTLTTIAFTLWMTFSLGGVGLMLCFSLAVPYHFVSEYCSGSLQVLIDNPILPLAPGCLGLAAFAVLGARVPASRESPPWLSSDWLFAFLDDGRDNRRREADSLRHESSPGWFGDLPFRLVMRRKTAPSSWRRPLLRQVADRSFAVPTVGALFVIMVSSIFLLEVWKQPVGGSRILLLSAMPMLVATVFLALWERRWTWIAMESLRPNGRREYVGDLARLIAYDMAAPAVANCAVIVVYLQLLGLQEARLCVLLPWLALTVLQYIAAACLLFWLTSFRHLLIWFVFLALMAVLFGLIPLYVSARDLADPAFRSPSRMMLAALGAGIAAVLFYGMGVRRWCRVDLG